MELRSGIGMLVGDGSNIDIESDTWVQGQSIQKKVGLSPNIRWVADLLTGDLEWKSNIVWSSFDNYSAKSFLQYTLAGRSSRIR